MPEIGLTGPAAPDCYAESMDTLRHLGHAVAQLGPGHTRGRNWFVHHVGGTARHTGRNAAHEEKASAFRSAVGVLKTVGRSEMSRFRARLFEASHYRAAMLTEFRPAIPELFQVRNEIQAFRGLDALLDRTNRLLSEHGLTAPLGDDATHAHRDQTDGLRVMAKLEQFS